MADQHRRNSRSQRASHSGTRALPTIDGQTAHKIKAMLPDYPSSANPVDKRAAMLRTAEQSHDKTELAAFLDMLGLHDGR